MGVRGEVGGVMLAGPLRTSAPPQIPSPSCVVLSSGRRAAQDDTCSGFEEPVRVYEVRWGE